jgi:hypothetical protein
MAGNTLVKFQVIQSTDQDLMTVQQNLTRTLNPIFSTQTLGGNILSNITLTIGSNTINHKLGRNLSGWQIIRQRAAASIFDTQDNNKTPDLTLTLTSSAPVSVDLYVF